MGFAKTRLLSLLSNHIIHILLVNSDTQYLFLTILSNVIFIPVIGDILKVRFRVCYILSRLNKEKHTSLKHTAKYSAMVRIIIKVCATMLLVVSIKVPRIKTCAQRYIKYIPNFQRPLSPNFCNIFRDLNRIQTLFNIRWNSTSISKTSNNQCKKFS